ncbi:InlB B-repeat-containing protein [Paenibacillus stellifer]|uniref:InlB B-repeat-containing protein n=1 Tax=Paenibacillus stellifer TaxID=169760 RepID=UPI0006896CCB|nr:InlB B-repeat-containing protein [Paenibacillus stellifer]
MRCSKPATIAKGKRTLWKTMTRMLLAFMLLLTSLLPEMYGGRSGVAAAENEESYTISRYVGTGEVGSGNPVAAALDFSNAGDNGPATSAKIRAAKSLSLDSDGNLFFIDTSNKRIRKVDVDTGIVTTVAGNGTALQISTIGEAPATEVGIGALTYLAIDRNNNIYFLSGFYLLKLNAATQRISVIAGSGIQRSSNTPPIPDGDASGVTFGAITGMVCDRDNNLYLSESNGYGFIYKISPDRQISRFAGISQAFYSADSELAKENIPATEAILSSPAGLAVDAANNLYYTESTASANSPLGNKVRKILAGDHTVHTVAGAGLQVGIVPTATNGDGGPATEAYLYGPSAVTVDNSGNVYIADSSNNKIRKITAGTGIITTIAGNGSSSATDEVVAPKAIVADSLGNLYVGYNAKYYISKLALNYTVSYNGNGSDTGSVPAPVIATGDSAVASAENSGSLTKTGYTFAGWNTQADGAGVTYASGESFTMTYGNLTLYAKWVPGTLYTLSYNGNGNDGGTAPASNAFPSGIQLTVADGSGLIRQGYAFTGWNTLPDGSGISYPAGSTLTLSAGDVTLHAQWAENPKYSIVYNGNGNTGGVAPASVTDLPGTETAIAEPGSLIRTGYSFNGWGTAQTATSATYHPGDPVTIGGSNLLLYAVWSIDTYRLTFETNGGGVTNSQTAVYNTLFTRPADPVRTGYQFDGWYTDPGLTKAYAFGTPVIGDVTLYAKWTAIKYTVLFLGGSTQYVEYNGKATRPADPVREGQRILGWYYGGTNVIFDFNTPITANIQLEAKWESVAFNVTFNTDGGTTVESQKVDNGSTAVRPDDDPGKYGYAFAGWYSDSELTHEYNFASTVSSDLTIYAKWVPRTYTVSFNTNGGTAVQAQSITYNEKVAQPEAPVKDGYGFGGWYSNAALTTAYNFNAPVTKNVTLYAKWVKDSYTVSFNSNGGTAISAVAVPYGTPVAQPEAPTKAGYTFGGWYVNAALTTKYIFSAAVEDDLTLYAKWTPIVHTISFNTGGGSSVAVQKVNDGGTATLPRAPTKEGYGFDGWYTDEALIMPYDFSAPVTDDLTLYAKWKANSYTVSFNSNGGTAVSSQAVAYGAPAQQPAAPVKTGYTFGGWYSDSALTTVYDFGAPVQGNVTLYAKWTVNSYTITFEPNGGTAVSIQTIAYGQTAALPTAPAKTGYAFGGWYLDEELTVAYSFQSPVIGDLTLYAKWNTADTSGGSGSGGSGGGGGGATAATASPAPSASPTPQPTVSTTGSASVNPQSGARVSQGDLAAVDIPAGALAGSRAVEVRVDEVAAPPAASGDLTPIAKTYEFTVGGAGYTFTRSVKITLKFDPALIPAGATPSIYYYDETAGEWKRIGGTADGGTITAETTHFTKYSVFAEGSTAQGSTPSDISGHWAEAYIVKLLGNGVVQGYPDGTFQPGKAVTRAEFASMLVKALNLQATGQSAFSDMDSHWAKNTVAIAADHGIVTGYEDGTFRPNQQVTRQEMVAMAVRAFGLAGGSAPSFADSGDIAVWAKSSVGAAVQAGIVSGQTGNRFAPAVTATRAEAVTLIAKALELN